MNNLGKSVRQLLRSPWAILIAILIVAVFVMQYSSSKGSMVSAMTNPQSSNGGILETEAKMVNVGETSPSLMTPNPAMPSGLNSVPASASGLQTITKGLPAGCENKPLTNPSDLLPKSSDDEWSQLNPSTSGELTNVNLLNSGYHSGIDTIGTALRNANLQVRSEPPNPQTKVSPWLNSTIEPDLMRVPLELGCGPQ